MNRPRLFASLALTSVLACSHGKDEAYSLVTAVDHYARASLEQTIDAGESVRAVACTDAEVCDAKRVCLSAIEPTRRALVIKGDVESKVRGVEEAGADDKTAQAMLDKLDEASRLLKEGRDAMPECERRVMVLRTKYGL